MDNTSSHRRVLADTIEVWFETSAGTSALDVARRLTLDHKTVLKLFEELSQAGHGSLNRDVELFQITFHPNRTVNALESALVMTHIFFPSKPALAEAFYSSDLPQRKLPEYKVRLHLGAHQLGLVFFSEEVLARYFDHPAWYEVNDTLAGGDVTSVTGAPDERSLYVRYGKSKQSSGAVAVTAIYKDLATIKKGDRFIF